MIANLILLLIFFLPALSTAWLCFPPTHLLPNRVDCVALILGLGHLSKMAPDAGAKRWGRHLSTTPRTEKLPRWYYLVDEAHPPATCAIVVDSGGDPSEVDTFMLADVVDAAKAVYKNCLIEKGQVGLEFPGEGHIFAQVMRLDGVPVGGLRVGGEGEERRVVLPEGNGVLYISDSGPGQRRNDSRAR